MLTFPFVHDVINGTQIEIIPVEPASCPTLTRGIFTYDFGDSAGMTPLLPMYTLGHNFIPEPIHAGGLRYHGMSPLVSQAAKEGLIKPRAIHQTECYEAAITWARTEGGIVAPESSHAIAATIQEAKKARRREKRGHSHEPFRAWHLDLLGYSRYLAESLPIMHIPRRRSKAEAELANLPKP